MAGKNLYLIETPFQLLNAIEAIYAFPTEHNDLYIRYSDSGKNDSQLKDLLKKIDLPKNVSVNSFFVNAEKRTPVDALKMAFYYLKLKLEVKHYENVFIGNYDSRFIKLVVPFSRKIIILDDGLKTISTQNNFTPNNYFDWFTIFDLKPITTQKIYRNKLKNLQSLIKQQKPKRKSVLFIGSKLSEEKIISEDYNLEIVSKIAKEYGDTPIKYVSHRAESKEKLARIEKIKNLEVVQLDYPLELLPIYGDFEPSLIISFFSTALITLSKIYKVKTIGYKFDYSSSKHKNNIQRSYEYCSQFFEIKDLPNNG